MKIAVLKEYRAFEKRVAATPHTVKKFSSKGFSVVIEKGAGEQSGYLDSAYQKAGATIEDDLSKLLSGAEIVLKIQRPIHGDDASRDELSAMQSGCLLIGILDPRSYPDDIAAYAEKGITAFSLELLPRITRAQTMDVLSSQSNLTGYSAVIDAAHEYHRAFPMMMTAAGTVAPARVLVFGAGVAGLQAIATAKRLGAVVSAFDVRASAKEQVESLGAKFIEVETDSDESGETSGGYAREMSDEYKKKQQTLIRDTIKSQNIVICTALIPGKKAPLLVSNDMLSTMKPGSVVVDLAVSKGGNCEASEEGKIVEKHGVLVIGHSNFPSRLAASASDLYARNLLNFVLPLVDEDTQKLAINDEDEIIRETMLTRSNKIVHPEFAKSLSNHAAS